MTTLWLVRHGQTDWNISGRWQGSSAFAPGLNDLWRAQALAVRDQLNGEHFSAIYSSDLLRARQTAGLIAEARGLPVLLEPRFGEINLGKWEGMLSADIAAQYPHELDERRRDPLYFRPPGGESPCEVAVRVLAALREITQKYPQDSILIVSHGVSLSVIICSAENYPMAEIYEHIPDNARPHCLIWPN